jgi:prepilin-type processing-associated H-X9-DG protein
MFRQAATGNRTLNITIASVTDGLSNTILIGETLVDKGEPEGYGSATTGHGARAPRGWATMDCALAQYTTLIPINYPITSADIAPDSCKPDPLHNFHNWQVSNGFKSNHSGGANFAFADGSIHFIQETINPITYIALGVRNDGAAASLP